jgi:hypothetical protein
MFEDALVNRGAAPAIAFRAVTTGAHEWILLTGTVMLREQYCGAGAKDGETQNLGMGPHLMTS